MPAVSSNNTAPVIPPATEDRSNASKAEPVTGSGVDPEPARSARRLVMIAAAVIVVVSIAGAAWYRFAFRTPKGQAPAQDSEATQIRLVGLLGQERMPAVSPDGSRVAFVWRAPDSKDSGIYEVIVGSQSLLRLTSSVQDYSPTWSPDGRQIAFLRDSGDQFSISSDLTPTAGGGTDYFQWNLDLSKSSELFYVTLQPNDSASAAAAPFTGPLAFHGVLHSRCFTSSGGYQDWTKIQPGYPDGNCAMRVNFSYNGATYTLVMSPDTAGTGTATVSCTNWSTSSKSCAAWNDVPNASAANSNVAYLYNTSGGQTYVGSYSLSFNVSVTHP